MLRLFAGLYSTLDGVKLYSTLVHSVYIFAGFFLLHYLLEKTNEKDFLQLIRDYFSEYRERCIKFFVFPLALG